MTFETRVRELFEIDKRLYFIFLCLITFLLLLMKKNFVESETAAFVVLESRGQMGFFHLINTFQYLTIPIIYLWKFTLIGFLLWLGSFAFGYKIPFAKCWQLAMIAESIFIVPEILKFMYFVTVAGDPDFFDIRAYYPLSLMSMADYHEVEPRLHYPLKALNLFEVVYWVLLMYGMHLAAKKRADYAVLIIITGYIFSFFLWLWFYISVYK